MKSRRSWLPHVAVALALACFILALFARLLFTDRVLASGDILHYFYPYRDYAAAAFRGGRIPLWNPFIFVGVPFLANPQAAVLYPLHWPLSWLAVTKQIYWSGAIHGWILGYGGYWLMRRWGYSAWAGLTTGLILAGSGFYGGLLGHLNQMNGVAWLPWMFLIFNGNLKIENGVGGEGKAKSKRQRAKGKSGAGDTQSPIPNPLFAICAFALLVALTLLAGHTQTAYINLFGVGVWVAITEGSRIRRSPTFGKSRTSGSLPHSQFSILNSQFSIYLLGTALGLLLSAAQLLPTLELSGLGLRSGGLTYAEASSFSLKPLYLLWTLLPSYGLRDLSVVFDTLGYTEFVAYVGLIGLILAILGGWKGRGIGRTFGLIFVGLGLFLALGRWNPIYFLMYKVLPGFDLFRTPARWMMLYTMGAAVLAGAGVEDLRLKIEDWMTRRSSHPIFNLQSSIFLLLTFFLATDLILASSALPHTHPTAPQAVYDVRTAPAFLLSDPARTTLSAAGAGRFLSMSTITFDPGDMADFRRIFREGKPSQLDETAFRELVIAQKSQEILAPNLPLLWRIPALDGFDGGVLPLQRYIQGLSLFIPADQVVPDGRLREQVAEMPPAALLSRFNVQYVITDKVRDLWFEGVYFDRQIGAQISPDGLAQIELIPDLPFQATQIALIATVSGDLSGLADTALPVAQIELTQDGKSAESWSLTAGGAPGAQIADPALDSPLAASAGAVVAYRDVDGGKQEYLVRLPLVTPATPDGITLYATAPGISVTVQAVTLVDARTSTFQSLLPSDRGRFRLVHSGDVKIYENMDLLPRAYLVHNTLPAVDVDAALARLKVGDLGPDSAVIEGDLALTGSPSPDDSAEILAYAPERVEIQVRSAKEALLVLSDSFYPGWQATVDGVAAPILAVNGLVRGVSVAAGTHTVIFAYDPLGWRRGLWISGAGVLIWLGLWGISKSLLARISPGLIKNE
ncbi:MAG: YfhO family protein [Caldilineaceae bacterium]|nr:YfhO family protein [Caldilineaceae bacterium]MBP8107590.1 YfhO family protein [Caldilineaceae bacterium]MBP8123801.1 YfhO family protein [Caldilineaceae bacterium]MBP9071343.1 YfhO family protein [Caldilineaceae bacterium]